MTSTPITHLEKLRFEKSKALVLVRCAHKSGLDIFVYLKMDKDGYARLLRDYENSPSAKFSDYGEVILFGEGEPNDETIQLMQSIDL